MGEDAFRRVQKQLLTDVSSARSRNKDAFIRDQLRRNMVGPYCHSRGAAGLGTAPVGCTYLRCHTC